MAATHRDDLYLWIEAHRHTDEARDVDLTAESWYDEVKHVRDLLDKLLEDNDA